ncbi:stage III sporulation protein AF [Sediminibacillus halophilus]|uniref:Stage III sporulation protein AF n=1 Tax=Sediminibacillus halophilus TaxID=482461 RepID=A0A1G9LLF9_9BACI|nr:stage III sporulation protein AF [Sediminibacillus halophilus]SDL62587.1 stage III sporulation protein AF [Sediminibacillus halophilus]
MNLLTEWVTQIILFLLLAMVIDLLMPNSSMKKYIKVVVGLVLILIFLQPLFRLFQMDIDTMMSKASAGFDTATEEEEMKNSIDLKKKEIQASQRAYILEEMAVQMKNEVEEGLEQKHDVEIADISFQFEEGEDLSFETLKGIHVLLRKHQTNVETEGSVEEVVIDIGEEPVKEDMPDSKPIKSFLFEAWGLEDQTITINWEEG